MTAALPLQWDATRKLLEERHVYSHVLRSAAKPQPKSNLT